MAVADNPQCACFPFLLQAHSYGTVGRCIVDFAVLYGKTPEEMFTCICCDPSTIKVHPKDKDKVDAASVTSELDSFVACALQLALLTKISVFSTPQESLFSI